MGTSVHPWKVPVLVLAFLLPSLGCRGFLRAFTPQQQQQTAPAAALDEPPPLHTGGLGVLSVGPSGQGPGPSPGSHGNAAAGGLATGVAMVVLGATATKTVEGLLTARRISGLLTGSGPADIVNDAGTQ